MEQGTKETNLGRGEGKEEEGGGGEKGEGAGGRIYCLDLNVMIFFPLGIEPLLIAGSTDTSGL